MMVTFWPLDVAHCPCHASANVNQIQVLITNNVIQLLFHALARKDLKYQMEAACVIFTIALVGSVEQIALQYQFEELEPMYDLNLLDVKKEYCELFRI